MWGNRLSCKPPVGGETKVPPLESDLKYTAKDVECYHLSQELHLQKCIPSQVCKNLCTRIFIKALLCKEHFWKGVLLWEQKSWSLRRVPHRHWSNPWGYKEEGSGSVQLLRPDQDLKEVDVVQQHAAESNDSSCSKLGWGDCLVHSPSLAYYHPQVMTLGPECPRGQSLATGMKCSSWFLPTQRSNESLLP